MSHPLPKIGKNPKNYFVAAISFFLFVSFFVPYVNVFCHIPHAFFYSLIIYISYGIYLLSFDVHSVLVYCSCSVGSLNRISSIW